MKSAFVLVAGIVVAALVDHRLGWGTVASVAVALYCHWIYRQRPTSVSPPPSFGDDDELRPGWAGRWVTSK